MTGGLDVLTLAAAVGCALMAGVFFAFSTFVMHALGRLPPPGAVAAMQAINVSAVRPAFMAALFGTAAVCGALVWRGLTGWGDEGAALVVAGGALYLVGPIGFTVTRNVPLNNALAVLDPDARDTAGRWQHYLRAWTAWNHARTVAALAAAVLLTLALVA